MTTLTADIEQPQTPLWLRLFYLIPVVGWIARDIERDEVNVYWAVGLLISAWGCSALLFGLPGLFIPAVVLTFVVFIVLLVITRG